MSYTDEDTTNINRILETENFYEILQVPSDATDDQIKSAYKKLALQVHPDKNSAPRAKSAFVVVRKATAVLLDKDKRREYDELGSSPRGFSNVKFDLSDEAVEAILIGAGIAGIAVGIVALCEWLFTEPKKEDNSKPKNS